MKLQVDVLLGCFVIAWGVWVNNARDVRIPTPHSEGLTLFRRVLRVTSAPPVIFSYVSSHETTAFPGAGSGGSGKAEGAILLELWAKFL